MTDALKPKRRWLQFSLRTLFIVVTVFCVWLAITAKRAREQRQAVEAIRAVHGAIAFQHQLDRTEPPGPEWLRQLIGDEYFFRVAVVQLQGPGVNDASLAAIGRFTELKDLTLYELICCP